MTREQGPQGQEPVFRYSPGEGALYRQFARYLITGIKEGRLSPGQRLPTEQEMIAEHGFSRNTARLALGVLRGGGYAHTLQGKGTFVADRPPEGQPQFQTLGAELPAYKKIAYSILQDILTGAIGPGNSLPSEHELMDVYGGVSLNTVRGALEELRRLQVIKTEQGIGSSVRKDLDITSMDPVLIQAVLRTGQTIPLGETKSQSGLIRVSIPPFEESSDRWSERVEEFGGEPHVIFTREESALPPKGISDLLRQPRGKPITKYERTRRVDGHLYDVTAFYAPAQVVEEHGWRGSVPWNTQGSVVFERVSVRDREPLPTETEEFELRRGTHILIATRTGFDTNRIPIVASRFVTASDRQHFSDFTASRRVHS